MLSRRIAVGVGLAVTTAVLTAGIEPSTSLHGSLTPFGAGRAAAYEIGELRADDFRLYRKAFKLSHKGRWSRARRAASQAHEPLLHKVMQWLEFAKAPREDYQVQFWNKDFTEAELRALQAEAHRRFYGRLSYVARQARQVRSFGELRAKAAMGAKILLRRL